MSKEKSCKVISIGAEKAFDKIYVFIIKTHQTNKRELSYFNKEYLHKTYSRHHTWDWEQDQDVYYY